MLDLTYFTALILILLRITAFLMIVPVFFPTGTPNIMKLFFSLILSYILIPGVNYAETVAIINNNYALILACVNEIMSGIVLGYITTLCFSSIKMAGNLMDIQLGLAMVTMFDPNSKSNATLLDRLLYWTSLIIFFIVDGHHMLLGALNDSFTTVALGKSMLNTDSLMLVMKAFTQYFWIGIRIALPIMLIILLTDLTLGLVARTVPQLNVMVLGLPIKILVGLTCFTFAFPMIIKSMVYTFNHIPDILKEIYKFVPFIFIFASEDKTEEATPKKKSEARKKGQVAKSKEVGLALTLLATTLIIALLGTFASNSLKATLIYFLKEGINQDLSDTNIQTITLKILWRFSVVYFPIAIPIMVVGIFANYIQTGFLFTKEPLKPSLSKINPLNGFKRMFSTRTLVELVKDLAIVTVVGYVGYSFIKDNYAQILTMGNLTVTSIGPTFKVLVVDIFKKISLIMIILAVSDYIYQRYMHNKDLRMTKQEIKEEYKQDEGDPQLKSKIKQKQREIASRRMMQSVPDATVVVTNPTHIAVALRYEEGKSEAPLLVAKGEGYIAIKIKEIAKENEVPIIENKTLARLIYGEVDIDSEIPSNMYQAVAEILALVYKLKNKK